MLCYLCAVAPNVNLGGSGVDLRDPHVRKLLQFSSGPFGYIVGKASASDFAGPPTVANLYL